MNRRNFSKLTALTSLIGFAPGQLMSCTTEPTTDLKISLAQWSLNKAIRAGKLSPLDFAKKSRSFGIDAIEYAKKMEDSGAGELLVTSMDRDGTQVGYDIDLMSKISSKVNIPVIASGGVGNLDHLVDGIKLGNASAVLAASIFHYGKHSVKEAKEYLDSKGIPVRI